MQEIIKNRKSPLINRLWEVLLYFTAMFPYIAIIDMGTDLQPNAVVVSGIFTLAAMFGFIQCKFNYCAKRLFVSLLVVPIIFLMSGATFEALRSALNYASVFFIAIMSNYLFRKYGLNEKAIKIIMWIWCLVAIVQVTVNPFFMSGLLGEARTSLHSSRGAIGLSNEPSFYGITMSLCLFFIKDFKKGKWFYALFAMVQIVVLSRAMTAFVFCAVVLFMWVVGEIDDKKKIFTMIAILAVVGILLIIFLAEFATSSRMGFLAKKVLDGTLLTDLSVLARFQAITGSLELFVENNFMPGGFERRIMSGFGSAIFELGLFALPMIYFICKAVTNIYANNQRKWILGSLFFIFMLGSVQMSHPMVGMLIGYGWSKSVEYENSVAKQL